MFQDTSFLKNDEIELRLEKTVEGDPARNWVPAYHFHICGPDGAVMGRCDLRIGYNENLYYGGHIGYTVFPEYRGHHFAGKACLLLFELAKKHGMQYLYITCSPENIASARTCEYAGGVLVEIAELPQESDMREKGETRKCIYRFDLCGQARQKY